MPELITEPGISLASSAQKEVNRVRMSASNTAIRDDPLRERTVILTTPFSDISESEGENQEMGQGYESEPEEVMSPIEARVTLNEQLIKAGYLFKRQERRNVRGKHWKKRWFVLRSSKLAYYKDEKEYELIGIIDMSDVDTIAEVKRKPNVFGISTSKRKYYMKASDQKELDEWVKELNTVKDRVQDVDLPEEEEEDKGDQVDNAVSTSRFRRFFL
jgi:hypothetical protein